MTVLFHNSPSLENELAACSVRNHSSIFNAVAIVFDFRLPAPK